MCWIRFRRRGSVNGRRPPPHHDVSQRRSARMASAILLAPPTLQQQLTDHAPTTTGSSSRVRCIPCRLINHAGGTRQQNGPALSRPASPLSVGAWAAACLRGNEEGAPGVSKGEPRPPSSPSGTCSPRCALRATMCKRGSVSLCCVLAVQSQARMGSQRTFCSLRREGSRRCDTHGP